MNNFYTKNINPIFNSHTQGLTSNELAFCYQYTILGSKAKAARAVGISRQSAYKMLEKDRVQKFLEHLKCRNYLMCLENEPEMLKGQRMIWANSNMADYFGENGEFVGFDGLSSEQASCIKAVTMGENKDGRVIVKRIELYDAARSNQLLSKPYGLNSEINIDLSLLDVIDAEDIEYLMKKYGW